MASLSEVFNKITFIFLALLLVVIMAGELILEPRHLATWPAFLIMIFYFMSHMNIKEAPAILIGSAFGLLNLVLITYFLGVIVPMMGGDMAKATDPHNAEIIFIGKLIYIAIFVAAIVFLKDIVPWVFNNYAFMCFTVAGAVSAGYTVATIAAHTVAGYANAVVAKGGNPEAIAAMKAATDKAIAATVPHVNVFEWIGIELIGGGIFIVAIYGINKLVTKLAIAAAAKNNVQG